MDPLVNIIPDDGVRKFAETIDCVQMFPDPNPPSGADLKLWDLMDKVEAVQSKAFKLWCDRQKKYGSTNISSTGALGCYVRANDKLARLKGKYTEGKGDTPDESVSDTWLDLMNYAMMGYMCHNGLWPEN